jgi:predicted nucleic acid-binding protein
MRERDLESAGLSAARARLFSFNEHSDVVLPSEAIRARAERLLAVHSLHAADAFHLAAALIVSEERPGDLPFVTLDDRLGEAAEREGFVVLPG